jgi:hypothetical protein
VCASTLWTSPDAPRPVDRAVVADEPEPAGWVAALDRASRLGLHGRVETQLLFGEPVLIVDERGPWSEVVAPWQPCRTDVRGYRGWVRTAHLEAGRPEASPDAETAVVTTPSAVLRHPSGAYVVSWATRLPVLHRSADVIVVDAPRLGESRLDPADAVVESPGTVPTGGAGPGAVPTGTTGIVPTGTTGTVPTGTTPTSVVDAARQFLGLRYLWGGLTGWGFDCSGLVHGAYRSFGVVIPRDAQDQHRAVEHVALDEVRVGDLYFFAGDRDRITHVGFATSSAADPVRTMLHAPQDSSRIVDEPLAPERTSALAGAGRVAIPTTDGTRPVSS